MSISSSPSRSTGLKGNSAAVGAPHQRQGAGHQLLGREGDGQDVIDPLIEGRQLGRQIAPPRQRDHRESLGRRVLRARPAPGAPR